MKGNSKSGLIIVFVMLLLVAALNRCNAQVQGVWKFDNQHNWDLIYQDHLKSTGSAMQDKWLRIGINNLINGFFYSCTITAENETMEFQTFFGWEITGSYKEFSDREFKAIINTHEGDVIIIHGQVFRDLMIVRSDHKTFLKWSKYLSRNVVLRRISEDYNF